jgi:hypothetical protein
LIRTNSRQDLLRPLQGTPLSWHQATKDLFLISRISLWYFVDAGGSGLLPSQSSARQFVGGALVALVLSGVLSLTAINLLNRYLGPIDDLP